MQAHSTDPSHPPPAAYAGCIALVGLPGCGKSTLGRQLARRLRAGFVDADHVIETRIGCTIRDFFTREGEVRFRDIEQVVIDELTRDFRGILATGGGAVLREANRRALAERTAVVYLRTHPDELYRRLRNDTARPLLQTGNPLERLHELYQARDGFYRQTAAFVVDTGRHSSHRLVNMILMQLELAGAIAPQQTTIG
ncbi:MAG: shikimate kinase [Comamonas sp.]